MSLQDQLEKLLAQKAELERQIVKVRRQISESNIIHVAWKDIKWISADYGNWTQYTGKRYGKQEGYFLCTYMTDDECCSSACDIFPELKCFETLDDDFGVHIIKCSCCMMNGATFVMEDVVDKQEYDDEDMFRLDRRTLTSETIQKLLSESAKRVKAE